MRLSFFSDRQSADLMSSVITDVNRLARVSSTVLVMAVRQVAMVAALLGVMFVRGWRPAVIALPGFSTLGAGARSIRPPLFRCNKTTHGKTGALNVRS